jgi:hypothetical protein
MKDLRSSEGLRGNVWTFSRSPDELIGSKTPWAGSTAMGIPLNVQTFIWKNLHPGKKIETIKFAADPGKESCKLVLLGVTLLK